jgi:hypothetical protein
VLFILAGSFHGALVGRAIVNATTYESIEGLPAGGDVRLVPREVAVQNATSAFNSPTETLTDFRIVNTDEGLRWTALRTPQGAFRTFTRKSQGFVELDAEQTARTLRQVDAEFSVAPGLRVTDSLRWRLLKRRFLIRLEEPVAVETAQGPRIIVPYLEFKGILVRRPVTAACSSSRRTARSRTSNPRKRRGVPSWRARAGCFPTPQARRPARCLPIRPRALERRGSSTRTRRRSPTRKRTASPISPTSAASSARSGSPWPSPTGGRSPRARSS